MSKNIIIILIVIFLLVGALLAYLYLPYFHKQSNDNENTNLNNGVSEEYVEYNSSYGKICPVGVKFLESKNSAKVECECPEGYEWDKDMVGSETGDNCYGTGTECPMFSAVCVKKKNQ